LWDRAGLPQVRADKEDEVHLVRLIYVSRFSAGVNRKALESILSVSRIQNRKKGITGVLCYAPGLFLQCLEGPRDAVNALYARILADSRHRSPTLLAYEDIHIRMFECWSMAYVRSEDLTGDLLLKFGSDRTFDPFAMSARQALGFLSRIALDRRRFLDQAVRKPGA
jgi:hypothetical protein